MWWMLLTSGQPTLCIIISSHFHSQVLFFLHDTVLPSVTSPSCLQTTAASAVSQLSLQTVPHCPPIQTSTLPSCSSPPPVSLMSVSLQDGPKKHTFRMLVKWYEHCYHLSYLEHICSEPNSSRWLQKLLASNWHVRSLSSFAAVGWALERTTQVKLWWTNSQEDNGQWTSVVPQNGGEHIFLMLWYFSILTSHATRISYIKLLSHVK